MPKRKSTNRIESEEVQGEGSYVIFRSLLVEEVRKARGIKDDDDTFELGMDNITNHIVEWNWVDEDGEPLPLPSDDPGIMDKLTVDEVNFLANNLTVGGIDVKNSKRG